MSGINLFLKYAYAPNIRGFCGQRDVEIFHEGLRSTDASGVTEIDQALQSFTGAVPYLQLIAGANNIRDPFNERVVEAYWIGNNLLKRVSVAKLYNHVRDRFKPLVNSNTIDLIAGQAAKGAKPHHAYHVFDAFSKTGGFERLGLSDIALNRIEECRIGWGTFEKYADETKSQIIVKYEPISNLPIHPSSVSFPRRAYRQAGKRESRSWIADQACPRLRSRVGDDKVISNEIDGYKLFTDLQKGDLVTFHWSRICDKISKDQTKRLEAWTKYHMALVGSS